MRLAPLFVLALLCLSGCAKQPQLAGPDADRDAQSFAAKPGMARLYLVHGTVNQSYDPYSHSSTVSAMPPAAGGLAGAVVAGVARGLADDHANQEKHSAREADLQYKALPDGRFEISNGVSGIYFLNEKKLGNIFVNEYMAIDLYPGSYSLTFVHGGLFDFGKHGVATVTLSPGDVVFYKSLVQTGGLGLQQYLEKCDADCRNLVLHEHRVPVDPVALENPGK